MRLIQLNKPYFFLIFNKILPHFPFLQKKCTFGNIIISLKFEILAEHTTPNSTTLPNNSLGNRWRQWQQNNPIPSYLGLFAIILVGFNLIRYTSFFETYIYTPLVTANALFSSLLLNIFGQNTTYDLNKINSDAFDLSIASGCDALTPIAIFVSVILAFPATWRQKGIGAGLGVIFLLVINLLRIVALYLIGKYYNDWFEFMHVEFFQFLFILLALLCCGVWLRWVFKN